MRLANTSSFPTPLVREVLRFVKPDGARVKEVHLRAASGRGGTGHAWGSGRIVATINANDYWGAGWNRRTLLEKQGLKARPRRDGYLSFALLSPLEELVSVLAHECRHVRQGQSNRLVVRTKTIRVYSKGYVETHGHTTYYDSRAETRRIPMRAPLRGMVWGSRGRFSERDADAYALRMLRKWRRAHAPEPWLGAASFDFVSSPPVIAAQSAVREGRKAVSQEGRTTGGGGSAPPHQRPSFYPPVDRQSTPSENRYTGEYRGSPWTAGASERGT